MKVIWGMMLILILGAGSGWAALGEAESSVSADGKILQGHIRDEVHPGYRLYQITDASGSVIREYVSPGGKIFGVAWQGPFLPNMPQLLGSYFPYLQQYAQAQSGRHGGPLLLRKDDFVFTSGGHMRAYHGRAYVLSLVPTHLTPEVVQ